jgi:LysM repeat protein
MTKCYASIIMLMIVLASKDVAAQGGSYEERAKNYVKQYAAYAIADQKASGVPAAITLGQGILETEAGISELVTEANNHFGIKCKNGWDGPTFLHTDDAKNECFKKYKSAQESYNDHSAHLHRNPRYASLFTYSVTDYARWAHGLKKCGYATNPRYAPQLIKIIEDYHLQQYTYAALDSNFEFNTSDEGQAIASKTTAPQTETETVTLKDYTQAVGTTTVITTTTTTTKTIRIEPGGTTTEEKQLPGKAPSMPAVAAMPSANTIIKDTSKNGMVAVSATTTAVNADAPKDSTHTVAEKAASPYPDEEPLDTSDVIRTVNGLKAVRAHKEETLLSYAIKYKVRYAQLLEMNDLPDQPLEFDTWIYLEKKNPTGINAQHIVREGESLIQVAQAEGIQLRRLAALNQLNPYEHPAPGAVLNLQVPASTKPATIDYNAPKSLPRQEVTSDKSNSVYTKAQENIAFGMGFEPPKDEPVAVAAKPQDTARREIVKQPFMREDPPQRQLKQPTTMPEYKNGDKHYLVKRGETAYSIAKKHNITVAELLEWNHLDPQDLKAGQTLIVRK